MNLRAVHFVCARLLFSLVALTTSAYWLLAYVPLTRNWVIECPVVTWLPLFVKWHPYLYWFALVAVVSTLGEELRRPETKRLAAGFILFHTSAGAALLKLPLLANPPADIISFILSLIALFPIFWLAAIDHAGHLKTANWAGAGEANLSLKAALLSAASVSLLYAAIFYLRHVVTGGIHFTPAEQLFTLILSGVSHLLIFVAFLAGCRLIRAASGLFRARELAEFFLSNLLLSLLGALVLRQIILAGLSFNTRLADLFAFCFALAVVALLSSLNLRTAQVSGEQVRAGVGGLLALIAPRSASSKPARLLWAVGIAGIAYGVPALLAHLDWNAIAQKLSALFVWCLVFAFFDASRLAMKSERSSPLHIGLVLAASIGLYAALSSEHARWPTLLHSPQSGSEITLERYGDLDVSFGVARAILTPPPDHSGFYAMLREQPQLITANPATSPPNLIGVKLMPTVGQKPHIFIIVVDSLRRDYLSPYNPAVNFTPQIETFARESVVWENAFTRHSGTVLSEPSIWAGAMMPHGVADVQAREMTALQKLVQTEGYDQYLTLDPVLRKIVTHDSVFTELDQGVHWSNYDFARTAAELRAKLDARPNLEQPVFLYTQPQSIHQTTVATVRKTKGDDMEFAGFDAAYAQQVRLFDYSFGEFIQFLKARGLYENSVVVLTADHGEALGEDGRWGHSYNLSPQVLRIPLLVHLPERYRAAFDWRPDELAFSADVTPSLYYLLRHRPLVMTDGLTGRPLFTETAEERQPHRQDSYLVACSYGPVYGVLGGDGRSLFVTDGINQRDYFYDLESDPQGRRNGLTPALRATYEKLIRSHLAGLRRFYTSERSRSTLPPS
ncbi:MAG: sulfatase-like hydrolase/transferase [Pyrinomonadaceae bacterium]